MISPPTDLAAVLDDAWLAAEKVPGFLGEREARFLGLLAALIPAKGVIVEIGSYKGRSTVMLAKVASHYGSGPVVSIDPHTHVLSNASDERQQPSTFDDFQLSIRAADVESHVEIHRAYSQEVSKDWKRPIRLLWIDGDHTYEGAKTDFDRFSPFLVPTGVVALHDVLNNFPGPIRVFVEEVLRSKRFGPAGCVQSLGWGQLRPQDAATFESASRKRLERSAARLIPFVKHKAELRGLQKVGFKLRRSRVPREPVSARELATLLG